MGFCSWITADTKESIANAYSHRYTGKPVYLLQPDGAEAIEDTAYEGYGVFGGIDVFAWLAKMNTKVDATEDVQALRIKGIYLPPESIKYPLKFSFNKNAIYELLPASEYCSAQGYFYDEL